MLLNLLQCKGQPPTTKNYPAQNVNSVETEKSYSNLTVKLLPVELCRHLFNRKLPNRSTEM